ncbi:MAG TPA: FtsH protease activity modulator HflK [Steroidobacteraceae bacterium]|jgi:membrane protease subunit HflK|nr:FtsH protease activity modulator HflK [Steroidobacteraceae bacterium]
MAWNQPDDKRRSSGRNAPDDPSLDHMLRRWQERVQRLWRPGGSRSKAALTLLALAVLVWLASGYYQISSDERGVVQTFGRYVVTELPGSGWRWPWPIQTMTKVRVADVNSLDSKDTTLTADGSLLTLAWSVQYRIADPLQYLFQVRDPQATLQQVGEVVVRRLAAQAELQSLLAGDARERLDGLAREDMQLLLDEYHSGIALSAFDLTDVQLPDPVVAAEHDADHAADDRQRQISDAQSYANDLQLKAQATAQHQVSDAQVYATKTLAQAQADTQRFDELAASYALQPQVLRDRLYIQTVQDILSHSRKIFVDARAGNGAVFYVPLDKLVQASGAGGDAAAAAAAAVESAPTSAQGERASDDDRSRARGER